MGWMVSTNPRVGRKELVEEILADYRYTRKGMSQLIDYSQKGNTLYLLLQNPVRHIRHSYVRRAPVIAEWPTSFELKGNYRFIAVYLLRGRSKGDEPGLGWGYKSMDESCGPGVYDCPERLLKQSQVEDRYGWRRDCRKVREQDKARRKYLKGLCNGDKVVLFAGWDYSQGCEVMKTKEVAFEYKHSPTFFIGHDDAGNRYRYRIDRIILPTEDSASREAA